MQEGDRFWRMPETYVRGNTIKYLRVPNEVGVQHISTAVTRVHRRLVALRNAVGLDMQVIDKVKDEKFKRDGELQQAPRRCARRQAHNAMYMCQHLDDMRVCNLQRSGQRVVDGGAAGAGHWVAGRAGGAAGAGAAAGRAGGTPAAADAACATLGRLHARELPHLQACLGLTIVDSERSAVSSRCTFYSCISSSWLEGSAGWSLPVCSPGKSSVINR